MATIPMSTALPIRQLPGRQFDHLFVGAMGLLLCGSVFLGFAHTHYLAGTYQAKLASHVLEVHAVVFTYGMVLLLLQSTLVSVDRMVIHRRLGIFGMFVAGLVVVMGVLAAGDSLSRVGPTASSQIASFSITPFTDMLVSGLLAGMSFRLRKDSDAHKRLILLATIALMRAANFRRPFAFVFHNQVRAVLLTYSFVVWLIAYGLFCLHRIHEATIGGRA